MVCRSLLQNTCNMRIKICRISARPKAKRTHDAAKRNLSKVGLVHTLIMNRWNITERFRFGTEGFAGRESGFLVDPELRRALCRGDRGAGGGLLRLTIASLLRSMIFLRSSSIRRASDSLRLRCTSCRSNSSCSLLTSACRSSCSASKKASFCWLSRTSLMLMYSRAYSHC